MRGSLGLLGALILGGSVGIKFVFGSSVLVVQSVFNGCGPSCDALPASGTEVQARFDECAGDGGEAGICDGGERVCDHRDYRPAVAVPSKGRACGLRAPGNLDGNPTPLEIPSG